MTEERQAVLAAVAELVDRLPRDRPARVAVDGVTAAGKSTFADELAARTVLPAIRVRVDDFHRPSAERHARGEGPESYYHDTFDLGKLRAALLGSPGAVLLVDGVFLLRPELADVWELSIFLAVDRAVALRRGIERDASWMGGSDAARARYEARYVPGEALYLEAVHPERLADVVVENTDPDRPRLDRRPS
ncbi:MAG: uridine kinase [Gaiellaceae bacterium]